MDDFDLSTFIDPLSKSLAVVVSVVGLLITLDQLTISSRLKRRESWLRNTLEHEKDEARRVLLTALLDSITARIVGAILVPARHFAEAVWWVVLIPLFIAASLLSPTSGLELIGTFLTAFVALSLSVRRGIRVLAERQRVVHLYKVGGATISPPQMHMLALMEGGTRREFLFSASLSISVILVAVALAFALVLSILPAILIGILGLSGLSVSWTLVTRYVEVQARLASSKPERSPSPE